MKLRKCHCGEKPTDIGAKVICPNCGAQTVSFVAKLGEFQREQEAAQFAWNRGNIKTKREVELEEKVKAMTDLNKDDRVRLPVVGLAVEIRGQMTLGFLQGGEGKQYMQNGDAVCNRRQALSLIAQRDATIAELRARLAGLDDLIEASIKSAAILKELDWTETAKYLLNSALSVQAAQVNGESEDEVRRL